VSELLSVSGYDVQTAEDGHKGLEAVSIFRPDVVLLDVEMPGISGLEVLSRLNSSVHYFSIIMFTSLSSLPQIVEALRMGADDYITKPFHNDELLARVEAAIRTARMKVELIEARQSSDDALAHLKIAQEKLVVEEKVASVARLSAGVAPPFFPMPMRSAIVCRHMAVKRAPLLKKWKRTTGSGRFVET
jgi:DNA-binding response OmpR family regulator